MKIIIPMTGYGSRFVAAGYKDLKPMIMVQGKPIIQWIVEDIYPGETDFLFVCRKEHLDTIPGMKEKIMKICPTGKIFAIDNWEKKGPVNDILRASSAIPDDEPCIVNYCDVYFHWDWPRFKKEVIERGCAGCVPCYTGFHPHLLPEKNLYASCLTDENDDLVEIREKYSFAKDKMQGKHSPGVYYFASGALLKKYAQIQVDSGETINGEYYSSLTYNAMVRDGLKVWIPTNTEIFCNWGTPEELEEYLFWTETVKKYIK